MLATDYPDLVVLRSPWSDFPWEGKWFDRTMLPAYVRVTVQGALVLYDGVEPVCFVPSGEFETNEHGVVAEIWRYDH